MVDRSSGQHGAQSMPLVWSAIPEDVTLDPTTGQQVQRRDDGSCAVAVTDEADGMIARDSAEINGASPPVARTRASTPSSFSM